MAHCQSICEGKLTFFLVMKVIHVHAAKIYQAVHKDIL